MDRQPALRPPSLLLTLILSIAAVVNPLRAQQAAPRQFVTSNDAAQAIPTFHCVGLYWSPEGGRAGRQVLVRFREADQSHWQEALPMRYNPIAQTDQDLADYRGSIVHLKPATHYVIELMLEGTSNKTELRTVTWSENPPIGRTVRVESSDQPLEVTESGTPDAWICYDGSDATIDVQGQHDQCIRVAASYVILRGFTLRGAGKTNGEIRVRRPIGAIEIDSGTDIIIEDCDISEWGRFDPRRGFGFAFDSAILSRSRDTAQLARVVIQRCKLHHPRFGSNSWYEPEHRTHPDGPQCISLFNTAGNHVIRYNECWSDMDRMFNDVIGGGSNASYIGSPGPDSDIYGNVISHGWDDGIEAEGGSRNVRIWGNYISQCAVLIGNAPCSIGPLYVWGNVGTRAQVHHDKPGYFFLKVGYAGREELMTGHQYVFHNTIFRSNDWLPRGGFGFARIIKHTMSRNNILQVREPSGHSISINAKNENNSFDYDLFNGRVPEGHQANGVRGEPLYVELAGFDPETNTGVFALAADSPGAGAAEVIPNFTTELPGQSPDIGAHQRGTPPLRFGVTAAQP